MKRRKRRKQKLAKRSKGRERGSGSDRSIIRQSHNWPLLECRIAAEWRNTNNICQVLISRKSENTGVVAMGAYVVDLACLGVKNAYAAVFRSEYVYRQEVGAHIEIAQQMMDCDLNLAAKIIDEAVKYARSLGFRPNKDIRDANLVLGDAYPENCDVKIPLGGPEGKPLFVNGPYDDVAKIMRVLERKVGVGNFNFVMMSGDNFLIEDMDDDDLNYSEDNTVEILP
ncbi:MAG: hypothetical protein GY805_36095 [Chloroflexi bacterium]|nr:hypothetical protein [Chloroflexota bacterium]